MSNNLQRHLSEIHRITEDPELSTTEKTEQLVRSAVICFGSPRAQMWEERRVNKKLYCVK